MFKYEFLVRFCTLATKHAYVYVYIFKIRSLKQLLGKAFSEKCKMQKEVLAFI